MTSSTGGGVKQLKKATGSNRYIAEILLLSLHELKFAHLGNPQYPLYLALLNCRVHFACQ